MTARLYPPPKAVTACAVAAAAVQSSVALLEEARGRLEVVGCEAPLPFLNAAIAKAAACQQRLIEQGARLLPVLALILLAACAGPTEPASCTVEDITPPGYPYRMERWTCPPGVVPPCAPGHHCVNLGRIN